MRVPCAGRVSFVARVASGYASASTSSWDSGSESDSDGFSYGTLTREDMFVGDMLDYYAILEVS